MKAPRNAEERTVSLLAEYNALVDGFFILTKSCRGRYIANENLNALINLKAACQWHEDPVPMCTISHGMGMDFSGSPMLLVSILISLINPLSLIDNLE